MPGAPPARASSGGEPISTLTVNAVTEDGALVGWTASIVADANRERSRARADATLRIFSDKATICVQWQSLAKGCRLTGQRAGEPIDERSGPWDAGAAMADHFMAALAHREGSPKDETPSRGVALAVSETVDAAARSLRRKRVVEVVREQRSEATAFKGNMTTLGCGLLVLALVVLLVTAVGQAFGADWMGYAWYVTIPLLIGFLLLQGLGLLSLSEER